MRSLSLGCIRGSVNWATQVSKNSWFQLGSWSGPGCPLMLSSSLWVPFFFLHSLPPAPGQACTLARAHTHTHRLSYRQIKSKNKQINKHFVFFYCHQQWKISIPPRGSPLRSVPAHVKGSCVCSVGHSPLRATRVLLSPPTAYHHQCPCPFLWDTYFPRIKSK